MTTSQNPLAIAIAGDEHRPVLERLWTMSRHDMSAFSGAFPDERARFRQERLDAALDDPGWVGYLLRLGLTPVGLAIVRWLEADERVMSGLFLVHGARRSGHGRSVVRTITRRHPGRGVVAFQDANTAAVRDRDTVTRRRRSGPPRPGARRRSSPPR